ncbi:MAG: hypothetical protein ACI4C5_04600 [Lachnospiraceae bacterium]
MSIVLTILKVIGIILAVVLGLAVALLLLALFLPLCYSIKGRFETEQNEVSGKCSWLFSLIQVKFLAKGRDIRVWLSICGWKKPLYPAPEKEETEDSFDEVEDIENIEDIEDETTIQAVEIPPVKETKEIPKRKKQKSLQKYLPWNMIKSWIGKMKRGIFSIKEKIALIKRELSDETNKNAVSYVIRELKKLIHYFGPRRGKADLRYSTGNPASTGQLTGILSLCPFCYKKGIKIVPDFASDKLYIQGTFGIHGHMQMFHLLGTAFRAYRNKDIKKIIQKFK